MRSLIRKELTSIFCSGIGLIFALIFLIACGAMLWLFEGGFNILDTGYATLDKFFSLSAILFLVLIPSLTMHLVAEEKKTGTFNLLRSRPISMFSILFSKWVASFLFVLFVLLSTVVYVYSVYNLGSPVGNLDIGVVLVSYLSLLLLVGVFVALGIFASALVSNQIIAFVIALFLNFVVFYGFDILAGIVSSGNIQMLIASCGLLAHYQEMQRGIIAFSDIAWFLFYFLLPFSLSTWVLEVKRQTSIRTFVPLIIGLALLLLASFVLPSYRFDFTKDKRYSLSDYTVDLMQSIADNDIPVKINVYLNGHLNSGFQRLRSAVSDLLSDLNRYADYNIEIAYIEPTTLPIAREDIPQYMTERGMPAIALNEVDRDGKMSKQLIYPYAQVIVGRDTLQVSLLKNTPGSTAEENLNASAEDLEFQFADALGLLVSNEERNIAFLEGHGELSRRYVYDAEMALSKYYNVNRGQIGESISVLDGFEVVIVAGAKNNFSESEKYVLDQYLMKGGSIFWLLDGVYVSLDELYDKGYSASIKNDTNLDDLLFNYGVRIQPVLLQDAQASSVVVSEGEGSQPVSIPWYYAPLLLPSPDNAITKYISDVRAEFVSGINIINNKRNDTKAEVLLSTSAHTHVVSVPEVINFDVEHIQSSPDYFNQSYIPASVSLDGYFVSAFENRPIPEGLTVDTDHKTITRSKRARMVVAGSSDIIRNEVLVNGSGVQMLPMGFDHVTGRHYGNKDFVVNVVNWLAGRDEISSLRSKTRQLNLLDRQSVYEHRSTYALINIIVPILLVLAVVTSAYLLRRRKYSR